MVDGRSQEAAKELVGRMMSGVFQTYLDAAKPAIVQQIQALFSVMKAKSLEVAPVSGGGRLGRGWWHSRGSIPMHEWLGQSILKIDTAALDVKYQALVKMLFCNCYIVL